MKNLLIITTLIFFTSCATRKQSCNTLCHNKVIIENKNQTIELDSLGSTIIDKDLIQINNKKYYIKQQDNKTYYCLDNKNNLAIISVYEDKYIKVVSVRNENSSDYYLLYSENILLSKNN